MSDDRTVAFRGTRDATDVLTWGQRAIWTAIQRTRPADAYFNFGRSVPGSGADLDTVLAAIAEVMGRHEALRTRLSVVDGGPTQVVSADGEITVAVIEGDAEAISAGYVATAFDYEHEWPVRFCVVTAGGEPAAVVVCFCHLAADFGGSVFVLRDLAAAIEGGPPDQLRCGNRSISRVPTVTGRSARRERRRRLLGTGLRADSDVHVRARGRRAGKPALPAGFPALAGIRPGRRPARQPAGHRQCRRAERRLRSRDGRTTGHDTCAMLTITKNRFREQTRNMVSTLALEGLLVVPLAGDFDDVVRTAWKAAVPAYRYAQYDERDRDRSCRGQRTAGHARAPLLPA